jgi:hypothetical protein
MLKQQLPNLLWQEEDQEVDGDNAEEEGEEADDDEAMGQSTVSPEPTCEAPTFTQECTRLSLSLCVLSYCVFSLTSQLHAHCGCRTTHSFYRIITVPLTHHHNRGNLAAHACDLSRLTV